jgi:hypothetical protein
LQYTGHPTGALGIAVVVTLRLFANFIELISKVSRDISWSI